jgi:hypothetical protein
MQNEAKSPKISSLPPIAAWVAASEISAKAIGATRLASEAAERVPWSEGAKRTHHAMFALAGVRKCPLLSAGNKGAKRSHAEERKQFTLDPVDASMRGKWISRA